MQKQTKNPLIQKTNKFDIVQSREGGKSQIVGGQAVIEAHLMGQVLLLNLQNLERENLTPPANWFRRPWMQKQKGNNPLIQKTKKYDIRKAPE